MEDNKTMKLLGAVVNPRSLGLTKEQEQAIECYYHGWNEAIDRVIKEIKSISHIAMPLISRLELLKK